MLAFSTQMLPACTWPAEEEVTSKECNNYAVHYKESAPTDDASEEALFRFIPKVNSDNSSPSISIHSIHDPTAVIKKLNHNAFEPDRRKKINCLYAILCSLLPDHTQKKKKKKLSIPQTVSRVRQYIPELQCQVERLEEKKEELLSKLSVQGNSLDQGKKRKRSIRSSSLTVLANRVGETDVVVQVSSAYELQKKCSLSDILVMLEEENMLLIDASSSEYFGGRIFYNLHLQVGRDYAALSEKLLSLYQDK